MPFVDEAKIHVRSGAGGDGCCSFRREKYIPKGGPDGGNGGKGGDVYLVPTRRKQSLLDFKFRPQFEAERGVHGKGKAKDGRSGKDIFIPVPLGTLVYDSKYDRLMADLIEEDKPLLIAEGGRGGRGNRTFVTSVIRAPRTATKGEPGQALDLRLELRLIADIGIVGLPNAGKSSLLSMMTRAQPKVADYPFSTLEPNLGVVFHQGVSFIVADLPGLIEGASRGVGLGHQFLRHATRTRLLLHLVDSSLPIVEIEKNIAIVRNELKEYSKNLSVQEEWLLFTKTDLHSKKQLAELRNALSEVGLEGHFISSANQAGKQDLLNRLASRVVQWQPTTSLSES